MTRAPRGRPPRRARATFALGVALGVALAAATAHAAPPAAPSSDPGAWALPDAQFALVLRGVDTLADRLDALEARYGEAPSAKEAIAALRAWRHDGIGPADRAWGAGLRLGAGAALYIGADYRIRLVLGADDLAAAKRSAVALGGRLGLNVTVSDTGIAGPVPLTCAQRGPFMVCDTGPVPDAAPAAGALPADTWASLRLRGPLVTQMLPVELGIYVGAIDADVYVTDDRVRVRSALRLRDDIGALPPPLLAAIRPTDGAVDLGVIHPRTPAFARLSLGGPALVELLRAEAPPELVPTLDALAAAWTGELTLSFVGGLTHPLLTLGLRDGHDGAAIVDALAALFTDTDVEVARAPGRLSLIVPLDPEPPVTLKLRHRTLGQSLAFALGDLDLDRAAARSGPPADVPPPLTRRGVHGAWVAHVPTLLGNAPPDIVDSAGDVALLGALTTVANLEAHLIDSLAYVVEPSEDAVALELWWSRL